MGTHRGSPGGGAPTPRALRPLLLCSAVSVAVCVTVLVWRGAATAALALAPRQLERWWGSLVGVLVVAGLVELAFYLLYWRPRRAVWNRQPCLPHAPVRLDAFTMFRRFVAASELDIAGSTDLETYLSIWFRGMPWEAIKRGNMEEVMTYGFWYRTLDEMDAAGLGHVPAQMVDELERIWNHKFPPGYTEGAAYMAHLWEDLKVQYRPLAFYMVMEAAALLSWGAMAAMGFTRHRLGDIVYYTCGLDDARRAGPGARASDGGAASAAPILFLHGVGGLVIYLDLIRRIKALGGPVIAVDIRHVGMRVSPRIPCVDEMTSEILAILDAEAVPKACVVGHSYGTLVASRLVKRFPSRLHGLCLVDPVCFGMYMPHLLHNFFYRKLVLDLKRPLQTFLDLIVHFASRDLHLSAAFSRRFYWSDVIMWPEELPPGSTVVLGAADDLVHANEVYAMLQATVGDSVRSYYLPGMFHGGFLVFNEPRSLAVDAIGRMARAAACDSHALAAAAARDAEAPVSGVSGGSGFAHPGAGGGGGARRGGSRGGSFDYAPSSVSGGDASSPPSVDGGDALGGMRAWLRSFVSATGTGRRQQRGKGGAKPDGCCGAAAAPWEGVSSGSSACDADADGGCGPRHAYAEGEAVLTGAAAAAAARAAAGRR